MFGHIFKNRLKCLSRNRILIFWTLLYPLVLGTFFNLAFSNLQSNDAFKSVPVAVVDNAEYQQNTQFITVLGSVSDDNAAAQHQLFHVSKVSQQQAEENLQKGEIAGYILFKDGPRVVVKESGVGQTILTEFMDTYLQTGSAYARILIANPTASPAYGGTNWLTPAAPGNADPDSSLIYYYALIAMAALFGGFWGLREMQDIQADITACGARVNVAPVHKLKAFGSSFLASITLQFACMVVLVAYMALVLGIHFSSQLPFILIVCLMGSVTGVTFGAFIGAIARRSTQLGTAILISVSLVLSFLSGLMVPDIKYTITHAVPALAYLNRRT